VQAMEQAHCSPNGTPPIVDCDFNFRRYARWLAVSR
jgi:hypothetical protein